VTPPGILSSGETVRFNAVVRDRNGKELPDQHVTWSILNPAVATVNPETGDLTPSVTFGQATVAATVDGVSGYAMLTAASPGGAQVTDWPVTRGFNPRPDGWYTAAWGFSKSEVYVAGQKFFPVADVVFAWNGTGWDSLGGWTLPGRTGTATHSVIWGSSSHDLFAAGNGDVIHHYDGTSWTSSATGDGVRNIWGSSPHDVWASTSVGLKHYDGKSWTIAANPSDFGGGVGWLWGFSSADVYAAGNGGVFHFDGSRWALVPGSSGLGCGKLWGTSYTNLYCLANQQVPPVTDGSHPVLKVHEVWHFNGTEWTALGLPGGIVYGRGLWGSSASDIYVVGGYFQILGYDGTSWKWYSGQPQTTPPTSTQTYGGFYTIWGIGMSLFTSGDEGFGRRGGDAVAPRDSLTS